MTVRSIHPLASPPDSTVAVPGSKSLTNRALVAAALADGSSTLRGALDADDTAAMIECLGRLGAVISRTGEAELAVVGTGGELDPGPTALDVRLSGTTARFLLAVGALGAGPYRIDGGPPLQARPMGPVFAALRDLGATVHEIGASGHLPALVEGGPALRGGRVEVPGHLSSQFISGLLLAGPCLPEGIRVAVSSPMVSRPFVEMTAAVMRVFGAEAHQLGEQEWGVDPGGYAPARYTIEPDASAAAYFFAAAAITGGTVRVHGLGRRSIQGDLGFVALLEAMGATVTRADDHISVTGSGSLRGIAVDMADQPDMAQTLAAVAVFAEGPTTVQGVAVTRLHETDRIAAVVRELTRCGIRAEELDDGFTVHPGTPRPARIQTYDDHRMAMAFSLLGLRADGIEIDDADVVTKTFPGYWDTLDSLRRGSA